MRTVIAVAALIASAGVGAGVAGVAVHESTGSTTTTVVRRPVTVNAAPAASTTPTGALSVSQIYQQSIDGVVEVLATGSSGRSFFGGQATESAQGTGFEVDRKGDIVTNYHVVANSDSVHVRLNDGHTYGGRVIGVNKNRDVAVIRISAPAERASPALVRRLLGRHGRRRGRRDRRSLRPAQHGHRGHRQRPSPHNRLSRQPSHHRCHPDRRRHQQRQQRRSAAQHRGPGDRRQQPDRVGIAGRGRRLERQHRHRLLDPVEHGREHRSHADRDTRSRRRTSASSSSR